MMNVDLQARFGQRTSMFAFTSEQPTSRPPVASTTFSSLAVASGESRWLVFA
jgi:hypothetical protein